MKWCITKEKKEIMNGNVITLLEYNQLNVIKCGYRNGYIKLPKDACIHAAQSGKIKMLKWVIKHGSVLTDDYVNNIMYGAIVNDRKEILKWMNRNGYRY
jgi:hypothetical protein